MYRYRLTRLGFHFLFVALFAIVGGSLRGFNLLLVLAGLLTAVVIVQWRQGRAAIRRTAVRRQTVTGNFAGKPVTLHYEVRNAGRWLPLWGLCIEDRVSPKFLPASADEDDDLETEAADSANRQRRQCSWRQCSRRQCSRRQDTRYIDHLPIHIPWRLPHRSGRRVHEFSVLSDEPANVCSATRQIVSMSTHGSSPCDAVGRRCCRQGTRVTRHGQPERPVTTESFSVCALGSLAITSNMSTGERRRGSENLPSNSSSSATGIRYAL